MHFPARFLWLLLFILTLGAAPAAETPASRPKIGLVLSGGGARGVGHIGVLRALEELHIPIDYVAGTSMGAIVGGLYASGMSPTELEAYFKKVDWRYLLSDAPPRANRSARDKERELRMNQNAELPVSEKGKVQLPQGLIAGQKLLINLREFTLPVRKIHDFDRLPIPFRAVATDLETGEMVVMKDGDLAESMRASMAVPGVFTPYRIGKRLLVDGFLASNLPIQTVRDMGADIIIAVDVRTELLKEDQLDSPLVVTNQMLDILMQRETLAQIKTLGPRDVYIRLKLPEAGAANFIGSVTSMAVGYAETMEHAEKLRSLSVEPALYQKMVAHQRLPRDSEVRIDFLDVDNPPLRHPLKDALAFAPGQKLEFYQLDQQLVGIEPLRGYEVSDFHLVEEDGHFGLALQTRRKIAGPNFLNVGFDFGYDSAGETDADLLLTFRMTELNKRGAEWETFLSVGDQTRAISEWYQPVDTARHFFLAGTVGYSNEYLGGVNGQGDRLRFRLTNEWGTLDWGTRLGQHGELRVGYTGGVSRIDRGLGLIDNTDRSAGRGELHAAFSIDTLDRANFPSSGLYAHADVARSDAILGAEDSYTRLEAQIYEPITVGKNTWIPRLVVGLSSSDLPLYDQFELGGFLNLSGLARRGLYDANAALAEIVFYREIAKMPQGFGGGIYAGFSAETGNVWQTRSDISLSHLVYAGSIFVGADTLLGPLYLGIGAAQGGETAIYLQLAPVFHRDRGWR